MDHFEGLSKKWRVVLKLIFKILNVMISAAFSCLRSVQWQALVNAGMNVWVA
jgi:hypothetical protein